MVNIETRNVKGFWGMDFEITRGCAIIGLDEMLDQIEVPNHIYQWLNKSVLNWNVSGSLTPQRLRLGEVGDLNHKKPKLITNKNNVVQMNKLEQMPPFAKPMLLIAVQVMLFRVSPNETKTYHFQV